MKVWRHIRKHPLLLSLAFLVGLLGATRLLSISRSPHQLKRFFDRLGIDFHEHYWPFTEGELHYLTLGNPGNTPLLLVHGSPGSLADFLRLIRKSRLADSFFIIIPDRPGFGRSSLPGGKGLRWQAGCLQVLLRKYFSVRKGVIAGHSFGAALALQLAADNPQLLKGVISLAGTIAAPHQKPRWYNYLTRYSPARWLINPRLISSNSEMWSLKEELPLLEEKIGGYHGRLALVQGHHDILVSRHTLPYFTTLAKRANIKTFDQADMNHFIIWTHISVVVKAIRWAAG